jgi:hypothetical protein
MSKKLCLLISFALLAGLVGSASAAELKFSNRCSWWSDLGPGHDWSEPDNWWTMDRYYYDDDGDDEVDGTEDKVYVKVDPNQVPDANITAYVGKGDAHINYPVELRNMILDGYVMTDPTISSGTVEANDVLCGGGYSLVDNIEGSAIEVGDANTWDPCTYHELTITGGTLTIGTPQTWEGYDTETWSGMWLGEWGNSCLRIGVVGWRASVLGARPVPFGGTMIMNDGTVNVGGHMEVGAWEEAVGKLNMNGGTINITQGLYCPASWWGAGTMLGQINLNGGTINARYFTMIQDPYNGNNGNLDIEAGKMVLGRNEEDKIQGYADGEVVQMSITAYGVSHGQITGGQRAALNIDYDVSAEGKTTVFASLTDPCQPWAPSPADGALNVKGPPSDLQRPILSWSAGDNAASHRVYFGTSFAEVNDATTSSGAHKGIQALTSYTVGTDLDAFGTYHWRIDEVNAVTVKGQVWDFTVANLGKSSYPDPENGEDDVSPAVTLGWTPGIYATSHDVYFGTSFAEVNDANTNSDAWMVNQAGTTWPTTGYDPNGLDYSTTYYWRIDEKDGGTYRGTVWSFTTNSRLIVDNFNSYANLDPDVYAVWNDYWVNGSDGELFALETNPDIAHDGNSIQFQYDNQTKDSGYFIGSWMDAKTSDLEIGSDWTLSRAAGLLLYFRGSAGNSVEKMWVELEDTSSNAGYVLYDGDANDITLESWHEWNVDLGIIDACGVTLSSLDNIKVGVGGYARTGQTTRSSSTSYVYFDDIEVWPARCLPKYASIVDFTDDCVVDGYDLETMAEDWMMTDYNTLGYMGTLKRFPGPTDPNYDLCWVAGKVDAGGLYFNLDDPDPNNPFDQPEGGDYVEIPPLNLNSNTVTFTLWVKRHGIQRDDGGLFFCSWRDDGPGTTESGIMMGNAFIDENCIGYNWQNDMDTYQWDPAFGELPNDEWAFVALTMSPSRATMYQMNESDGILQSNYNDVAHAPEAFGIPSRIGDHKNRPLVGTMDDFRIYDYTLDASEIEYIAKGTGTPPDANHLYAHYKFNETTGLTAADDAGDALNYWPVPSVANICGDDVEAEYHRFVNLIDFACFADYWLDVDLWP